MLPSIIERVQHVYSERLQVWLMNFGVQINPNPGITNPHSHPVDGFFTTISAGILLQPGQGNLVPYKVLYSKIFLHKVGCGALECCLNEWYFVCRATTPGIVDPWPHEIRQNITIYRSIQTSSVSKRFFFTFIF